MRLLGGAASSSLPGWAVVTVNGLNHLDFEDLEFLDEVRRLVAKAVELAGGSVPPAGSPRWWDAPPVARLASLLVIVEHHLLVDPDRIAAEQLKAAAVAISTGKDWSGNAHRLICDSHAKVAARRLEPGPLAGMVFDAAAEARWVATGSSAEAAA